MMFSDSNEHWALVDDVINRLSKAFSFNPSELNNSVKGVWQLVKRLSKDVNGRNNLSQMVSSLTSSRPSDWDELSKSAFDLIEKFSELELDGERKPDFCVGDGEIELKYSSIFNNLNWIVPVSFRFVSDTEVELFHGIHSLYLSLIIENGSDGIELFVEDTGRKVGLRKYLETRFQSMMYTV
ncbi:hypothetical protein GEMRC1_002822 [Eukaryota sp. GEM-RC1]